jgi:restriction system protein
MNAVSEMAENADPLDARGPQLRLVEHSLLERRARVINVNGAPGSGKTSLVNVFLARHRDAYPGGSISISAAADLERAWDRIAQLPTGSASLVVLDDFQYAPVNAIRPLLDRIERERPEAQVITISDLAIHATPDTAMIEMPPLGLDDVMDLLAQRTGHGDPARLRKLGWLLEGNSAAVIDVSQRLASGMPADRIIEWLERRRLVVARDAHGVPLEPDAPARGTLDIAVTEISDELIAYLAANPERLYDLDPRRFEELVAELYRRRGFEVTLTPASGDEGVDVYVVRHDEMGQTLWVVQAKRYAARHPIGAGVVRELYGTVAAKNASAGVLVTTSFFQPGAERFEKEFRYRLSLRDYLDLQDMLRW